MSFACNFQGLDTEVSPGYEYAVSIWLGLCAGAPLLMAIINPDWPYWYDAFLAQVSADRKPPHSRTTTDQSRSHSHRSVQMSSSQSASSSSRRSSHLERKRLQELDDRVGHSCGRYERLKIREQASTGSSNGRLSCELLDIVCVDDSSSFRRGFRVENVVQGWGDAGLKAVERFYKEEETQERCL